MNQTRARLLAVLSLLILFFILALNWPATPHDSCVTHTGDGICTDAANVAATR